MRLWTTIFTLFILTDQSLAQSEKIKIPMQKVFVGEGFKYAVQVEGLPLLHTNQYFGKTQDEAMEGLVKSIQEMGCEASGIVKLTTTTTASAGFTLNYPTMKKALSGMDPKRRAEMAAWSFVVGKLADPDASFAVDAVVATRSPKTQLGVLRPGPRVNISGQAEKGATPAEAARNTLASLKKTLDWLGCTPADVVQAKAFLKPITAAEDVRAEFAALFEKGKAPPLVFVEWESSLPVEIELIANAPTPKEPNPPAVEYLTPPGMTASPVYCRVARVNAPETIYINSLYSAKTDRAGPGEVPDVFAQLGDVLKKSNSDFHHLVKATYYVSANDVSTTLNELRPKFYDPKRPPAASKAMVAGVGMKDRSFTMDMIAVRKR